MRLDAVDHDDYDGIDVVYNCHRQRRHRVYPKQDKEEQRQQRQRTGEGFLAQTKTSSSSKMPLLSSLPTPVLSIAPDAVRHLEGGDALSALWAVFTKCSETIQDGRRLENVSWRLWYRQLNAAALAATSITAGGKRIGDERMVYCTADEKFAREDEEWDEKMGLLAEEAAATADDTNTVDITPNTTTATSEKERKAGQEEQRYPLQLDTCTKEAQSLVLEPHDQAGVATTTFTATSTSTSTTASASVSLAQPSATTQTSTTITTTTTSTTTELSSSIPRTINSASPPSPTSLVPRPTLRRIASSPQGRRKSFLAVVGPGGRMNVGQIICDLISDDDSQQEAFGGFESVATSRTTTTKMLKRWHSESAVAIAAEQEMSLNGGHEVQSVLEAPRTSRGSVGEEQVTVASVTSPAAGSEELTITSSSSHSHSLSPPSTPKTSTPATPRSTLMIPASRLDSPHSAEQGPQQRQQQQQHHHHHQHCVSQLPTPGAEMDDAGSPVDGLFGLEPRGVVTMTAATATQGSTATSSCATTTTTRATTVCMMGEEEAPATGKPTTTVSSQPGPPAVIAVHDLSVPHTPPESEGIGKRSPAGTATTTTTTPNTPTTRGPIPPKLVIVNPTPGPTPQPTPPSTPLLEGGPARRGGDKGGAGEKKGRHGAFLGVPASSSRRGVKRGSVKEVSKKEVKEEEVQEDGDDWEEEEEVASRGGVVPKLDLGSVKKEEVVVKVKEDAGKEEVVNSGRISPCDSTRSDDSGLGSSIVSLPLDGGKEQAPQQLPVSPVQPSTQPSPLIPQPSQSQLTTQPLSASPQEQQTAAAGPSGQLGTSVTSVTSISSAKSTRSNKSLGAAAPALGMTRRASSGSTGVVTAGRSKAKGGTKARVSLGGRSKSTASLGARSRSRGREDAAAAAAAVGLAAAAVGVMTAAIQQPVASTSKTSVVQDKDTKKRRSSSGDALSRRRVSGLAALTRTLSHEDVLEVTEDDDDGEGDGDDFEDESTDAEDDHHDAARQAELAAQLRRQQEEEDRMKTQQLLLRARQLEEEERRRVAEYEREVQAEKEMRDMMIIEQQQQKLQRQQLTFQQQREIYQREQQASKIALQRQREEENERREMEERIRVQQAALRAAEAEARAQAQADARAAAEADQRARQQAQGAARTQERHRASVGMGVVPPRGAVARTKRRCLSLGSGSDDGSVSAVSAGVVSKGSEGSPSERGSSKGKEREVETQRQPHQQQQSQQQAVVQQQQQVQTQPALDHKARQAAKKSVPADNLQLMAALQAEAERAEREAREAEEEEAVAAKGKNKQSKDKGKGKQRDKSTSSSSAAGVMTSLASPLLPTNNRKKIVVATSESEYTTDDDEGDSWTSEEGDDSEPQKPASVQSQPPQQPPQQQQPSHARRPSYPETGQRSGPAAEPARAHPQRLGLHRTQSNASGYQRFMTKREQDKHSKMLIERAALQLRREEEEKQRHKEMFAKKPTSSFQNVAKLGMTSGDKHAQGQQQQEEGLGDLPPRTKSALSLLLNPDPSIFPENHPYRRGYSSGELVRPGPSHMMGLTGMGGFGPMTSINAGGAQRPQMHPIQMGHDARMDQAGPPQRKLGAEDRLLSERIRARDAAEVEQKQKQAAQDEQERVRQLVAQKEKLEEEERAKRARIQQVEQEEKAQQKQLQQALQERAQRQQQQQQQRQPQRRVTDPPPPPNAQPPQEQQRPQHRRQASHASQQPKASRPPSIYQQGGVGSMMPMAFRGVGTANKSSAAMPVASQVDIGPIAGFERPPGPAGNTSTSNNPAQKGAPGHRPRGPPQGQELDTDSEDEAEDKENANALNMAKSIAEQKLRMFAEKRGIVPAPLGPAPAAAPPSPLRPHAGPSAQRPHSQVIETTPPWARQPHQDPRFEDHRGNGGPRVTPQPIPLMHPYNLPVAAIPTTPRTTRKLMLRTELSESVRRGLLWERQQGVKPIKRTASASNAEGIARFPPIPQLAASPSMVQLRPKVRRLEGQEQGVITAPVKKATPEELEERKKRALARNRSDANNFHTSGW